MFPAAWWWTREPDPDRKRLLLWAVTLIVLLSFSGEQRARYFLPLWPVFAVLVAEFCVRGAERARGLLERAVALYLVLMITTGAFLIWGTAPVAAPAFLTSPSS